MTRKGLKLQQTPKPLPTPLAMSAAPKDAAPSPIPRYLPNVAARVISESDDPLAPYVPWHAPVLPRV